MTDTDHGQLHNNNTDSKAVEPSTYACMLDCGRGPQHSCRVISEDLPRGVCYTYSVTAYRHSNSYLLNELSSTAGWASPGRLLDTHACMHLQLLTPAPGRLVVLGERAGGFPAGTDRGVRVRTTFPRDHWLRGVDSTCGISGAVPLQKSMNSINVHSSGQVAANQRCHASVSQSTASRLHASVRLQLASQDAALLIAVRRIMHDQ